MLGFFLSGWISKQYLRVFGKADFEDQLEKPVILEVRIYCRYQQISVCSLPAAMLSVKNTPAKLAGRGNDLQKSLIQAHIL